MFQYQNLLQSYSNQCQCDTGIRTDIEITGREEKVLYTLAELRKWADNGWRWLYKIVERKILRKLDSLI